MDKKWLTHTVKQGDTLWKLAKQYNTSVNKLKKDNKLPNPNFLKIGQKLQVNPGPGAPNIISSFNASGAQGFRKITPVNGFDAANPDNARQNDYAWSMEEMGDYLYVGTGRNIVLSVFRAGYFGANLQPPSVFIPQQLDMRAEIWRYKKDGSEGWQRVYKAPNQNILGFRHMIRYTTPGGETALYAGAFTTTPQVMVFKSTDGVNWRPINTGITTGSQSASTRAMVVHGGRLYMGVLDAAGESGETLLYESTDPEREGWRLVTPTGGQEGRNPRGGVTELLSFNNHLYVATSRPGGFELWRTQGLFPAPNQWKLLVDRGAGDALNEVPLSMGVFNNQVYVGTAILFGVVSIDPNRRLIPPKGFDVIRVNTADQWELVVGSPPVEPTNPTTGRRGAPISGLPSGFGNLTNGYSWQLQAFNNELYLGTWDWSVLLPSLLPLITANLPNLLASGMLGFDLSALLTALRPYLTGQSENPPGFDIWKSPDGVNWTPVTLNGLGNQFNYGARNLFVSENGNMYVGTANPFQGAEVWEKKGR